MSRCESCRYSFKVGCGQSKAVSYGCDFINMTGELRGCPAGDECTRYMELVPVDPKDHKPYESNPFHSKNKRKVVKNMAKLTEQNKRDIITKRNCGASLPALAREYKVTPTAISDVCKKYSKYGESMFNSTADTPAEDNPYTVTPETDMNAYMADRTENEPAAAATVTSSEDVIETVDNTSADIITENTEDVKPSTVKIIEETVNAYVAKTEDAATMDDVAEAVCEAIESADKTFKRNDQMICEYQQRIDTLLSAQSELIGKKSRLGAWLTVNGYEDLMLTVKGGEQA